MTGTIIICLLSAIGVGFLLGIGFMWWLSGDSTGDPGHQTWEDENGN